MTRTMTGHWGTERPSFSILNVDSYNRMTWCDDVSSSSVPDSDPLLLCLRQLERGGRGTELRVACTSNLRVEVRGFSVREEAAWAWVLFICLFFILIFVSFRLFKLPLWGYLFLNKKCTIFLIHKIIIRRQPNETIK